MTRTAVLIEVLDAAFQNSNQFKIDCISVLTEGFAVFFFCFKTATNSRLIASGGATGLGADGKPFQNSNQFKIDCILRADLLVSTGDRFKTATNSRLIASALGIA